MIRVIDWNWYCVSMQTLKILIILERCHLKDIFLYSFAFHHFVYFFYEYTNIRIFINNSLLIIKKCFNNKRAKIFLC